jgi:hypothetical protein
MIRGFRILLTLLNFLNSEVFPWLARHKFSSPIGKGQKPSIEVSKFCAKILLTFT